MFYIIDSVRTNNFTDANMIDKIMQLWQQAQQQLSDNTGAVYGVYHQYESDYRGDYTLSIAVEQPRANAATISLNPLDQYRVFIVDGNHEDNVYQMWQQIWGLEQSGQLVRAYDVDFEKYHPDGQVEIYISLA